jgi:hypothetical protein
MTQKLKKCAGMILKYLNIHFKLNNSKLLPLKAFYNHHSNDIEIGTSIAIVLYNLNQTHILSLFF